MLPELEQIDRYRRTHLLTWKGLAAKMRRAGFGLAHQTLHQHLKRAPDQGLHDITVEKLRGFLAHVKRHRQSRNSGTPAKRTSTRVARRGTQ